MSTPRRHDHDASGDPDLLAAKAGLREQVWDLLESAGAARFPGVRNRISNVRLAEAEPFFLLDPDDLADTPRRASSIRGASASARTVAVADMRPVDLVVGARTAPRGPWSTQ